MSASPSDGSFGDGVDVFEEVVFGEDMLLVAVGISAQFVSLPVCQRILHGEGYRGIVSYLPKHVVDSSGEKEDGCSDKVAVVVEKSEVDIGASSLDMFLLCDSDEVGVDPAKRHSNRVSLQLCSFLDA